MVESCPKPCSEMCLGWVERDNFVFDHVLPCSEMCLGWVERDNFAFGHVLPFTITECICEKIYIAKTVTVMLNKVSSWWCSYIRINSELVNLSSNIRKYGDFEPKMWNIPYFQFGGSSGDTLVCFLVSMRMREISVWTYLFVIRKGVKNLKTFQVYNRFPNPSPDIFWVSNT